MNKPNRSKVIAAFDKNTYGFISFYPNPGNASRILFNTPLHNNRIKLCADHKVPFVKEYIFEWIEDQIITSESIKKAKEKVLTRNNIKTYKLTLAQDNYRITIPTGIIELLNLCPGDKMKITTSNNKIIIEKF